jgi:putative peptide zinc metalloprotease protein
MALHDTQWWHRVESLCPQLNPFARVYRHQYRGKVWYVIQDTLNNKTQRFTPEAYRLLTRLDGKTNLGDLWLSISEELGDDAPSQEDILHLLSQLFASGLLQTDVTPDTAELFVQQKRRDARKRWKQWFNPFSIRLPIFDPDVFLTTTFPFVAGFFNRGGALLWCVVVGVALVVLPLHWGSITQNWTDQAMSFQNLFLAWGSFLILKVLHELGHAYAVKAFGGEVHEIGVSLLIFSPVPYVDASASSAFANKYHRAIVAAAGMIVELFIASLAFFIWLLTTPGWLHAFAFNTFVVGSLTSLVFNGNPLLRYDGYYILSDLIEIPNLGSQSNRYLSFLIERYVFGKSSLPSPVLTEGEKAWFVSYAPASFVYRWMICFAILIWLSNIDKLFGLFLTTAALILWIGFPLFSMLRYLLMDPKLAQVRSRAWLMTSTLGVVLGIVLFILPWPYRIVSEGVVWLPDDAYVRNDSAGFIQGFDTPPGEWVEADRPLVSLEDIDLRSEFEVKKSELQEIELQRLKARTESIHEMQLLETEQSQRQEELGRLQQQLAGLSIKSKLKGQFIVPEHASLIGRYVKRGHAIGYVLGFENIWVRTVLSHADISMLLTRDKTITVRFSDERANSYSAQIDRISPLGNRNLPSKVLGTVGGGEIIVDPSDEKGEKTVVPYYVVDVVLATPSNHLNPGGRAYVGFDFGSEAIAYQVSRFMRQTFLQHLGG